MHMKPIVELLDRTEEELVARAFLFEHPSTYREAIKIAFEQLRAELSVADRRVALG